MYTVKQIAHQLVTIAALQYRKAPQAEIDQAVIEWDRMVDLSHPTAIDAGEEAADLIMLQGDKVVSRTMPTFDTFDTIFPF